MSIFNCFTAVHGKKNRNKDYKSASSTDDYYSKLKTLQARPENPPKPTKTDELKLASFSIPTSFGMGGNLKFNVKVTNHGSPVEGEAGEIAYAGEDKQEECLSVKRDNSDFDFQSPFVESNEENNQSTIKQMESYNPLGIESDDQFKNKATKNGKEGFGATRSGHLSDPGIGKVKFWASPKLNRSCSDVGPREVLQKIAQQLLPSKDESFEDLKMLAENMHRQVLHENAHSPRSMTSHCSADKVMLKKHSSSQILPSRSRRLWWKLFLWSHRNMHMPLIAASKSPPFPSALSQQGGYCSDNLEPNSASDFGKKESPVSFPGALIDQVNDKDNQSWGAFHGGVSGFWPQNQWVALSIRSPRNRVDQWVQELANQPLVPVDDDNGGRDDSIDYPPSPETGRSPGRSTGHSIRRLNLKLSEEILHANSIIQSLNSSSTVAHIAGVGLKVIPTLLQFSSLRSVNLSGNSIVHVTPRSLPKGLHTLNLSRNKISAIEGFRELTRLRVLDLSYNRISRIGHGLSNCALIKELYLDGNKISDVEGLHRLLKLSVLDLSFNKLTTTKSLGQLVANYSSLVALNLSGNPIQSNISDDQLRKAVCGLLPKLAYLNKQPLNSQKVREVATESIAKAALGNSSWISHKKGGRRVGQGRSVSSSSRHRSSATPGIGQSRSKGQSYRPSSLKVKSFELASSSR